MKDTDIDMGEYREISPVEVGRLTLTGFQFGCDNICIFFCINGVMYENKGAKRVFGKGLYELFPQQYSDVIAKIEQQEKDIAKMMWKNEPTR